MTGVDFLSRAKELYPKTVRLILSGYADLSSVTDAINRGAVYKFLTKPWDNEILCANVLEAFRHYELTRQKNLLSLEIQEANTTLASLSLELSKMLAQKDTQIERISNYDQLTNLPNRSLFIDRLNRLLVQEALEVRPLATLLIDLDHFKNINDSFGYVAGDRLLQTVAKRLANIAGENDTLARMDGNEFGLLLTGIKSGKEAGETAQQILDSFVRDPIAIGDHETYIGVSIGISIYPSDGPDSNTLIKNASAALRKAKNKGQSYVFHTA
jgi:diguanylate cyclase (GGDEF)-like protein